MSGGLYAAEQGTLTIMAGGETVDIDEAMPILSAMGSPVHKCGSLGSGQILKLRF